MRIIIDAMGGDNAPDEIVRGACLAVREYGCEAVLVGERTKIDPVLKAEQAADDPRITSVQADGVIETDDNPAWIAKEKKDCSMAVALQMLADGKGDAVVSAGSTAALLTGATIFVRRIRGIRRAALAAILPSSNAGTMLIDCGANIDCTPEYLLQFGFMGSYYMQKVFRRKNARVALLNVGTEESKGDALHLETFALLRGASEKGRINFTGNVEGRDGIHGGYDVIVADGFSGNVFLKTIEGTGMYVAGLLKKALTRSVRTKLAAMVVRRDISGIKKEMDYREYGGAPLLGINAPVIKAHGSADAYCMKNAIKQAIGYADTGIVAEIRENVDDMKVSSEEGA